MLMKPLWWGGVSSAAEGEVQGTRALMRSNQPQLS